MQKKLSKKKEDATLAFNKGSDFIKRGKFKEAFIWFTLAAAIGDKKSKGLAEELLDKNLVSEKDIYNAWIELSRWFKTGKNVDIDLKLAKNFESMAEDSPWGAED